MPRAARIVLANCPHHIVHRGHKRSVLFTEDADYLFYLENLSEWKAKLGCNLYAYCLMTIHVHLIIDPGDDSTALGSLMKRLAARYTRNINKTERRTGTVWEGRYKSSPIDTDEYLLVCSRYVELNPERAGIMKLPRQYRWSSYNEKSGRRQRCLIDEDPCYRGLGHTRRERESEYRKWATAFVSNGELDLIRAAAQRGQLTGNHRFVDEVERRIAFGHHSVRRTGPTRQAG